MTKGLTLDTEKEPHDQKLGGRERDRKGGNVFLCYLVEGELLNDTVQNGVVLRLKGG